MRPKKIPRQFTPGDPENDLLLSIQVMDIVHSLGIGARVKMEHLRSYLAVDSGVEVGRNDLTRVLNALTKRRYLTRTPVGNGFWYSMALGAPPRG